MRFLILPLLLVGCAAPGSSTKIPQPVAIALAGGDVAELPPEAWNGPPVELAMYWYDRQWGIQVDRDGEGAHFVDLQSAADGANALEARKSDNQRATDMFGQFTQVLQQGMALGMGIAGGGAQPDPIGQAVGGFLAREGRLPNAAELDALYRSLQTLGQPLAPTQPTPPTPTNSNLIPGTVPGVPEPRQ